MSLQNKRFKNLKRNKLDYHTRQHEIDFCLLIPCYNNIDGLILSLNSVEYYSNQFLILIVDDGSRDPLTYEKINIKLKKALSLHILRIDKNEGIAIALNTGLEWIENNCSTKYIARLDAGDICDRERFYLQINQMNSKPEIGLTGTWCLFEDRIKNIKYSYKTPVSHKAIVRAMHFRNVFIHPTVMFRKELIKKLGVYPSQYPHAEDYAFFWNIVNHEQVLVLNKFLVICEVNRTGISFKNRREQLKARQRVISDYGNSVFLKAIGILRLRLFFFLPKKLILYIKQLTRQ